MACSHEGDIGLAKKIIDASAIAGADAVQLQIWSVAYMMSPQRKEFSLCKKIEFSCDQWRELLKYSRGKYPEIQVYVCVYEHQSIDFIAGLGIDGFKLNSSDLSNPLVLEKVAKTGKPINLSIGASKISEIQSAIERIRLISESKITLMYGHQSFPTLPENVHMSYMVKLKELFELPIGYQDHCDADTESAFWLPAVSMGMGVVTQEKHITHDRSYKGVDYESALNPDEFKKFVEMIRIIDKAKGSSLPRTFSDDEKKYREFQKKSIVATRDLKVGTVLTYDDLTFMRAESLGIAPDKINSVIGKSVVNEIVAYQPLSENNIS